MTNEELLDLLKEKCGKAKRANGNWAMVKCPTCAPRDAIKMKRGVNLQTLATNCFICEVPLTISDLIGSRKFDRIERETVEPEEHHQARTMPCTGLIPINQLEVAHPAITFLQNDFLYEYDRYWDENEIGFIPQEGAIDLVFTNGKINTADSLVFPVRFKGELIGWQLRFIPGTPHGDAMQKIRYMHLFKKGKYLYNYDNAKQFNRVVVVEGVKKSLKFPNAIATLGKGITEEQIQLLLHWKEIIFLYDAEEKAQEKAIELVEQINFGGRRCININPAKFGYPSPDEIPKDVAIEIVNTEWTNKYGRD